MQPQADNLHASFIRVPASLRFLHPDLYLLLPEEIDRGDLPSAGIAYLREFRVLINWVREFLNASHADLGVDGDRVVCPFVGPSMSKRRLWLTVQPGERPEGEEVHATMLLVRDVFLAMEPVAGTGLQLKSILVMFPDVPIELALDIIDGAQNALKPSFVQKGLMIGQFHELSEEPGLHNPLFRPLRAPVPLLAIRNMVPGDFLFLKHEQRFVRAYLDVFGDDIPQAVRHDVEMAAERFGIPMPSSRKGEE